MTVNLQRLQKQLEERLTHKISQEFQVRYETLLRQRVLEMKAEYQMMIQQEKKEAIGKEEF